LDGDVIQTRVRECLAEWRGVLGRQVAWTRRLLQKVLAGKMTLTPVILENGERAYELSAEFTLDRLFGGILPAGVASQICASWNHLAAWLRAVDCRRRAA